MPASPTRCEAKTNREDEEKQSHWEKTTKAIYHRKGGGIKATRITHAPSFSPSVPNEGDEMRQDNAFVAG